MRKIFFTGFGCGGFEIYEGSKPFLQVLTQSLHVTSFDSLRSKIFEAGLFLGPSQSVLFIAFCDKRSEAGEVTESFFWSIYF